MNVNNSSHEHKTAIILLAAGNSSRLGRSKQLLKLADGNTLLGKAIDSAKTSSAASVYVVLGANYDAHKKAIAHYEVDIVRNENWSNGMGSSIKTGVDYVCKHFTDVGYIIINVCDQPYISATIYNQLIEASSINYNTIVTSAYNDNNYGVPVLFPKSKFTELLNIDDELGAKSILKKSKDILFVSFPEGALDIDIIEEVIKHIGTK